MKTVDKALSVLDQFSLDNREIGLSDLARMADLDKAATRRLLVALAKHGFIEQSIDTRKYRLGHGFLRLARIREATVPLTKAAEEVADWLVLEANETVHITVPGKDGMTVVALRLPRRSHVVNIAPAEVLFYHATASGLVFMAHCAPAPQQRYLELPRDAITSQTRTDISDLRRSLDQARTDGFAETRDTYERGVSSIAVPFGWQGETPTGAVGLALLSSDLTDERRETLRPLLAEAAARMERAVEGHSRARQPVISRRDDA